MTKEYTGGSVSYYSVEVKNPTTEGRAPYIAECNDIIEALGMNYAEGNAFKAIWRRCAARMGQSKEGYKDGLYDAEKVVFFGERMVAMEKAQEDLERDDSGIGWIEWKGGECPVAGRAMVDARFGNGSERLKSLAENWNWSHHRSVNPIIAYRLSPSNS